MSGAPAGPPPGGPRLQTQKGGTDASKTVR